MIDIGIPYGKLSQNAADLCAFMLVAQHGSLTAAAHEMKISQPSLSQRIKNLELSLQRKLFVRLSTGMRLTDHGRHLFRQLDEPLSEVAQRFQSFATQTSANRVVIAVDFAFATYWLVPRLPQLREDIGPVDVRVLSSQNPAEHLMNDADLTICLTSPNRIPPHAEMLIPEHVSAVCCPELAQTLTHLNEVRDLPHYQHLLIHLTVPPGTLWTDWDGWLASAGVVTPGLRRETVFNTYEMVIKAAAGGQGIALGWHGMIDPMMHRSELVKVVPDTISSDLGYHIIGKPDEINDKVAEVRSWIVNQIREQPQLAS